MQIAAEITSPRRFAGPQGQVLAIFDSCRSYTLYAEVGTINGRIAFVSEPRTYFADEVREITNGGWL